MKLFFNLLSIPNQHTMKHLYAFLLFTISLTTANAQLPTTPLTPYAICSSNTGGFAVFNLKQYVASALSIDASLYSITFYVDSGLNIEIQNPTAYTNTSQSHQTIYVKVTEIANTSNSVVKTLDLYVEEGAVANNPDGVIAPVCDYEGANDGFVTTDLTLAGDVALGTQNPANFSVSYYTSEAAAVSNDHNSPEYITNPSAFVNTQTPTQRLWIIITPKNTITGCSAVTSFNISVTKLPNDVELPTIIACDNIMNLTLNNSLYGNDINFSYYTTQADAIISANPIATPSRYTLPVGALKIWVKAGGDNCYIIKEQTLIPYETPISITLYIIGNTVTVNAGNGEFLYSIEGVAVNQTSNIFTNVPYGDNKVTVVDNCGNLMARYFTVINIPAPTGSNIQVFTDGQTLNDLAVNGENITWYTTATGFTVLPKETLLVDGTTYYAAQTIDDNQSANRLAVTAKKTLGLNDLKANKLTYYPNPVTDVFTLNNSVNITAVNVYNTLGQVVINQKTNSASVQLNLQTLTGGVYIVKVTSGLNTQSFKIVKR